MDSFDRSDLKERNRAIVYSLFAAKRSLSKADVSRETGISGPTVLKIVEYFEQMNLLIPADEIEQSNLTLGRRPRPLKLNPDAVYTIGVEYDGIHLALGIVDTLGNLRLLLRKQISENLEIVINNYLENLIYELIDSASSLSDFLTDRILILRGYVVYFQAWQQNLLW